jgi:hypothetical protein
MNCETPNACLTCGRPSATERCLPCAQDLREQMEEAGRVAEAAFHPHRHPIVPERG